jgi:hypothetical protein
MYLIWFSVLYYCWNPADTNVRLLGFVVFSYISFTWIVRSYRWILTTYSLFTDIGSLFMRGKQITLMVKDWVLEHIANRMRSSMNAETSGDQRGNPGELLRADGV